MTTTVESGVKVRSRGPIRYVWLLITSRVAEGEATAWHLSPLTTSSQYVPQPLFEEHHPLWYFIV